MGRLLNEDDVYALFALNGTARLHVADIDVLPRVDAKKVVHGRWEKYHTYNEKEAHRCSVCYQPWRPGFFPDLYCPNCGAKMDGDGNA